MSVTIAIIVVVALFLILLMALALSRAAGKQHPPVPKNLRGEIDNNADEGRTGCAP